MVVSDVLEDNDGMRVSAVGQHILEPGRARRKDSLVGLNGSGMASKPQISFNGIVSLATFFHFSNFNSYLQSLFLSTIQNNADFHA